MTTTAATFRQRYPEFACIDTYTPSQVNFYLDQAYLMLNATRWGRQLDMAAELYTAHHLSLEARAQMAAAAGAPAGATEGITSSKSVDKVSVSKDVGAVTEADAGHWNSTVYGTRLYRLIKMFGAGGVAVGIGFVPAGNGLAWPGPITTPGFTNFGN